MQVKKSFVVLAVLSLGSFIIADNNLLKNGSFEDFTIKKDRGKWKIVTLKSWEGGDAEVWNSKMGKPTPDGEYKMELDVGRGVVDRFYQNINLEVGQTYKISIDAYARKLGTSKFYIELDDKRILTVEPTSNWQNYSVEFNATKDIHKISIAEVSEENNGFGAILDNMVLEKVSIEEIEDNSSESNISNGDDEVQDNLDSLIYTKLDDNLFLNDKKDVAIYIDENLDKNAKLIYDYTKIKEITNNIYNHFRDDYDFIFLITNNDERPASVTYSGVFMKIKNDVEGIGVPIYSNTQAYGSNSKLKGVMHFAYRGAILKGPTLHEISHYWANKFRFDFNEEPYYRLGTSGHWGYLGFFGGRGQLGGYDANTLRGEKDTDGGDLVYTSDKSDTIWRVYSASSFSWNANGGGRIPYNDLELYLMGMIPKSEVADLMVPMPYGSPLAPETKEYILNNNISERGRTYFMAQSLVRKSWSEIMSEHNIPDRNPDVSSSQKSFKVLTILLDTKMPKLHEVNGISLQMEKFTLAGDDGNEFNHNFWEATRGIGTLSSDHLDNSLKSVGEDYIIDDDYQEEIITFHGKIYKTVRSPYTGRVWLDRNIGADHVCQSFTDRGCYGYYFQFGRGFDGHQLKDSPTTNIRKSSITPDDNEFVMVAGSTTTSGYDWVEKGVDDSLDNRLEVVNRTDGSSVCPVGFRLPTYDEFYTDTYNNIAWDNFPSNNIDGNFLRLPFAGYRNSQDSRSLVVEENIRGAYWTSSYYQNGDRKMVRNVMFKQDDFLGFITNYFANGQTVRCIKDNK